MNREKLQLQEMKGELDDKLKEQHQEERKEPTLHFADIEAMSEREWNETTVTFQSGMWLILQHNKEWMKKVSSNNIQHPRDIKLDKAIIEAKFRDDKILKKLIAQLAEVVTAPYFQQIGPLAMIQDMHMRQGYYNNALQAYVDQGQVTSENTHEIHVKMLEKAHQEADAEVQNIPEMDSQEAQDAWWKMF
ncbi:hypothetical protein ACA910_006097 [Epithemia clementina (nom. ined.)]